MKSTTSSPVHAHHLDAGCLLDHRFHDRPSCLDQMGSHLFEQIPPLFGGQRLDQLLFGCRQNAVKANHERVADQVGVNALGSPAHVLLLKANHPFTRGGLDFLLAFHDKIVFRILRSALARSPKSARRKASGLWARAYVVKLVLLKMTDPFINGGFDFRRRLPELGDPLLLLSLFSRHSHIPGQAQP